MSQAISPILTFRNDDGVRNFTPSTLRKYALGDKIVYLVGEAHEYKTRYETIDNRFEREDHPYDKILRLVETETLFKSKDRKLLLLTEGEPIDVFLQGGKRELSPELFRDTIKKSANLEYIRERCIAIEDKYAQSAQRIEAFLRRGGPLSLAQREYLRKIQRRVLATGVDIRGTLQFDSIMIAQVDQSVVQAAVGKRDEASVIAKAEQARARMMSLLSGEEWFRNAPLFTNDRQAEIAEFFDNGEDLQVGCPCTFEAMSKTTKRELGLIQKIAEELSQPDSSSLESYLSTVSAYGVIASRLMDIYAMEFILRAPPSTTVVLFAGAAHTKFIGNALAVMHGFQLEEREVEENLNNGKTYVWEFPMMGGNSEIMSYNFAMEGMRNTFSQRLPPPKFIVNEFVLDGTMPRIRMPPMLNNFGSFESLSLKFRVEQGDVLFAALANPLTRPQLLAQAAGNPDLARKIQSLGFRVGPSQRI